MLRPCLMCGSLTQGVYIGRPFCLDHYLDGTLATWLQTEPTEDTMTDGPSLTLRETTPPPIDLTTFAQQIEIQETPTFAGLLELMGNELYRRGMLSSGTDLKDVARALREG
ncbi:MAG TPA: hypothetical protein VN444_04010 [Verrucomicrobiae bacterium]|nr:hypothetical protein [Verrucomicrobiae bacterium]